MRRVILCGLGLASAVLMANENRLHREAAETPVLFYAGEKPGEVEAWSTHFRARMRAGEVRLASGAGQFQLTWPGARAVAPVLAQPAPTRMTKLIGDDPAGWRRGLATFGAVHYRGLYPGIDLEYHRHATTIKGEYRVAPGASPAAIRMRFDAAGRVTVAETASGALEVRSGEAVWTEPAPLAFQEGPGGVRVEVPCRYRVAPSGEVGFAPGLYDPSRELVIDPIVVLATFLGGAGADAITGLARGPDGGIFAVGWTESPDFPRNYGAYTSGIDAFLVKFQPDTRSVAYAVIFGGSYEDKALAVGVTAAGQPVVAGTTTSTNYPRDVAVQVTLSGSRDGFVSLLYAEGTGFVFSTYHGGDGADQVNAVAIEAAGTILIGGETSSSNFPGSGSGYQQRVGGGLDGFVSRFSTGGSLLRATYLGGDQEDRVLALTPDPSGNVLCTGSTYSTNFPTAAPFQSTNRGGQDAFVTGFANTLQSLNFSSYLGGSGGGLSRPEAGNGIATDSTGRIYVVGTTASTNFPVTGAQQPAYAGGSTDAFLVRLAANGSAIQYGTFYGGTLTDGFNAIARGSGDVMHVAGYSTSLQFPVQSPVQGANAGAYDAVIVQFASGGASTLSSSYWGGSGADAALAITTTSSGEAVVAGQTLSGSLPLKNPIYTVNSGGFGGFLLRLGEAPSVSAVTPSAGSGTGATFVFDVADSLGGADVANLVVIINGNLNGNRACYFFADRPSNRIYLADDTGNSFNSAVIGSASTLSNSQCSISLAGASLSILSAALRVTVPITFQSTVSGVKQIWTIATSVSGTSGDWKQVGTYSVSNTQTAPVVDPPTPASGRGTSGTLTFNFRDAEGADTISGMTMIVNAAPSGVQSCYMLHYRFDTLIYLASDSGSTWNSGVIGSAGTLSNSKCSIALSGVRVTASGNSLQVAVPLTFFSPNGSTLRVLGSVSDRTGLTSGWQEVGSWSLVTSTVAPSAQLVSPVGGSGNAASFLVRVTDADGSADIDSIQLIINTVASGSSSCYIYYNINSGIVGMADDTGNNWSSSNTSAGGTLSNSRCIIDVANTRRTLSGNTADITVPITFKTLHQGPKTIWVNPADRGGLSPGFQTVGSFTVTP